MRKRFFLFFALPVLYGCESGVVQVIDEPRRLAIQSVFAINGNRSVTLGWTGVVNGNAGGFLVYRGASEDFVPSSDNEYAAVPAGASRFVDTSVLNGIFYYYRIIPVEVLSNGQRRNGNPSKVVIARPYDYGNLTTINYSQHIQQIFTSGCAVHGCHVGYDDSAPDKRFVFRKALHGGQFSLKSWADLFEGSRDGAVVIPYKASKSDLVLHVNSDTLVAPVASPHMPLPGFDLPPAQVQTLMRWISQGAPNDQGGIAYTVTLLGKVFAVNASEDLVAVIDVQSNLVIRYVNVGRAADSTSVFGSPHHVRVDRQGRYFYVTLINSQQLWKFSAATHEFLGRVSVPPLPADIAISPGGDTAYVTNFALNQSRVTVVDTRDMRVIETVNIPPSFATRPHGALLSPDGSRLFTTNFGSGTVTMINTADNSFSIIALDTAGILLRPDIQPYLADITQDGRFVYVACYGTNDVRVIDLQADSMRARRIIPVGARPLHVAITPDGSSAFVCNQNSNSITVINFSDSSTSTIANVGRQPHGVIFTPDGTSAYVTTENLTNPDPPHHPTSGAGGTSFVVVIDVATKTIVKRIEVGAFGQGIAFAP